MFFSFTQKYPPVKFLSEKDRKRILVSLYLLGGCAWELRVQWCDQFTYMIKVMNRSKVSYFCYHMCTEFFASLTHSDVLKYSEWVLDLGSSLEVWLVD